MTLKLLVTVLITSGRQEERSEDQLTEVLIGCSNKAIHAVGSYLFCLVTFDAGNYHPLSKFEGGGDIMMKIKVIRAGSTGTLETSTNNFLEEIGDKFVDFKISPKDDAVYGVILYKED
ncbi:hypothetical protein [Shouchella lehensis]|uniref:Uncharacterized protein n=1 Tax=Shouchella lehensis G1 TaxID=1246626 RepID=A0A060LW23_9BACI|nr:hypothetical protein [Shouchella lehensis]AIC95456.1 hypothetical protein BleG1_2892 [Shouchella lehensis G1]